MTGSESPAFAAIKDNVMPLAKARGWAVHVFAVGRLNITAPALVRAWEPDGCIVYAARPHGLCVDFGTWHRPVVTMNAPHPMHGVTWGANAILPKEQEGGEFGPHFAQA